MALAIWRSKRLTTLRDSLPLQVAELIARARALPWPAPIQRVARLGLLALAKRSKTAAWLIDRAQEALDTASAEPLVASASAPEALPSLDQQPVVAPQVAPTPRRLDALAYAMRSVSAETCIEAIADLTDRGDAAAGALLLDLLEDTSGFFIPITRLAAARGLQRVRELEPARIARVLALEQDLAVADALRMASVAFQ